MKQCAACDSAQDVVEMTDGRNRYPICGKCHEMIVTMMNVYGSLPIAVEEVRQAKLGAGR